MSETVFKEIGGSFNEKTAKWEEGTKKPIPGCVIDTAGQSKINGEDIADGNTDTLRILMPPTASLEEGDTLIVRGVPYLVKHVPFDYSIGRRPVLSRHRPKKLVIAELRES